MMCDEEKAADGHVASALALMELAIQELAVACTCLEDDEVCRACLRAQEIERGIKIMKGEKSETV